MNNIITAVIAFGLFICISFATMFGWAHFRLWKAEYAGKAFEIEKKYIGKGIKAEADYAKLALVAASEAELDSAQNIADAIAIVGEAAQKYPEYRQQQFFASMGLALENGNISQIMYVPTEGMLPIMEAGKRPEVK